MEVGIRLEHDPTTGASRRRAIGTVEGDVFVAYKRDIFKHLFRGRAETVEDAIRMGTAAWGLDLAAMEGLQTAGVRFVEVPTKQGKRYRTTMDTLLGPKSYTRDGHEKNEFGGFRAQVFLTLNHWTEVT